jgi:hypothetical protein
MCCMNVSPFIKVLQLGHSCRDTWKHRCSRSRIFIASVPIIRWRSKRLHLSPNNGKRDYLRAPHINCRGATATARKILLRLLLRNRRVSRGAAYGPPEQIRYIVIFLIKK